jgi:DNA-binding response OmpR family regulator
MSKTKVLYVEDELFLGKIVRESLESRGFDVLMEEDGAKVLARFKKDKPDICVLDVMLPNKDGFTIADEIRELDEEVPIIFLTAKTQTEDVVKGFTLGGNDYIRKPFSMEELIVRMQHLLAAENGGAAEDPGQYGNDGKIQFPAQPAAARNRYRGKETLLPRKRIIEIIIREPR